MQPASAIAGGQISAEFAFEDLAMAPLVVDALYRGGVAGHRGDDPIQKLLGVGNAGGFRLRNTTLGNRKAYGVLYTSGFNPDWPDKLDEASGTFVYHGDQRTPGRELHDTPRRGNAFLRDAFHHSLLEEQMRLRVPPLFLFAKAGTGSDVIFRGLLVPGSSVVPSDEHLVAIWRTRGTLRYQNYRAIFTVLNVPTVERQWCSDLMEGRPDSPAAPSEWLEWTKSGVPHALRSQRPREYRTRAEQLPTSTADKAMITAIREHFRDDETAFEPCAAALFQLMSPAARISQTRAVVDGGRDAFGTYGIGPVEDSIQLDWSLEAKCFSETTAVRTPHTARLISRLRHRQFGVLVTTSFVDRQAYKELREDRHPVVVMCAADIVRILRARGFRDADGVAAWLQSEFPLRASRSLAAARPGEGIG